MKKLFVFYICLIVFIPIFGQDIMLTRNGDEYEIKLDRISTDKVYFINLNKKRSGLQIAPTDFVYMIKTEKRGTIFFNENGEQITHPNIKVDKKDDVVYLMVGQEVVVYDLNMNNDNITFKLQDKKKAPVKQCAKKDVFMIRHSDGSKDLLAKPYVSKLSTQAPAVTTSPTLPQSSASVPSTSLQSTPTSVPVAPLQQSTTVASSSPVANSGVPKAPTVRSTLPALNITAQEIFNKVYEANPYTLYEKGSVAEYCAKYDGEDAKLWGAVTYMQQTVVDVKIENGLYVVYEQQSFFNKKHEPSKGIPESFKNTYYPTEIDTAGTFHWTHDLWYDAMIIKNRSGYAALFTKELNADNPLQTSAIRTVAKNLFGGSVNVVIDYSQLKVVGNEKVTTPCGTFDCVKISGQVSNTTSTYKPVLTSDTWWVARGIGLVRYDSTPINPQKSGGLMRGLVDNTKTSTMYLNKISGI